MLASGDIKVDLIFTNESEQMEEEAEAAEGTQEAAAEMQPTASPP